MTGIKVRALARFHKDWPSCTKVGAILASIQPFLCEYPHKGT